jgi:hypothetical protein
MIAAPRGHEQSSPMDDDLETTNVDDVGVDTETTPSPGPPMPAPKPQASPSEAPTSGPAAGPIVSAGRRSWQATVFVAAAAALLLFLGAGRPRGGPETPTTPVDVVQSGDVALRITSTTSGARVRIDDGAPVALPLETKVARDGREHTISVGAPGFGPRTKTVRFGSERVILDLSLSPAANGP